MEDVFVSWMGVNFSSLKYLVECCIKVFLHIYINEAIGAFSLSPYIDHDPRV